MRRIIVTRKHDGVQLDRFVRDTFCAMPPNAFYKALRNKDIKIDGKRVSGNCGLSVGQCVDLYIKDEILLGSRLYEIVFEDADILVINKYAGICVCDAPENEPDLTILLTEKMKQNIYPCHRLDRNTAGIVIFAKSAEAEKLISDIIREHKIEKKYCCIVSGRPPKNGDTVRAWLRKNSRDGTAEIFSSHAPGSVDIITEYRILSRGVDTSMLEIRLITGRTHQIRAQMAYLGCPVLGDGKYGRNAVNKSAGYRWQALVAKSIKFAEGIGTDYDGMEIALTDPQVNEHFEAARMKKYGADTKNAGIKTNDYK